MTVYALDTTTFSELMREDPKAKAHLASLSAEDRVVVSTVVRGEIQYGLQRISDGRRKHALPEKAARLFEAIPCEGLAPGAGDQYAHIKREAELKGTPLDENDLWIAAAALDSNATLIASDSDPTHRRAVVRGLDELSTPTAPTARSPGPGTPAPGRGSTSWAATASPATGTSATTR